MAKVGPRITLGADPEFELVVGGRVVSASGVLQGDIRLPWGDIGIDGAGRPLELRPLPSETARGLVANVGRLIIAVPKTIGGFPSTMCEAFAVGGHIHIGFTPIAGLPDQCVVNTIDNALGDIFYSLNTRTRLSEGYGRRGDWRGQRWGIEYRTPPASVWSHPRVALTFVGAIKWVVKELLRDRNPLGNPVVDKVRAAAKNAAAFVKGYQGRLHWGAWQSFVGEVDISRHLGVKIHFDSGDRDSAFFGDIEAMCARLGISSVRIVSLRRGRGDRASNVPGYGVMQGDFAPFTPGGTLCLSWRFRTDPEFRKEELPKLEAAIAAILRDSDEGDDGGRLVKEVVPLKVTGVAEEPEPEPMDVPRSQDDEDYVRCECGNEIHVDDMYRDNDGNVYCERCYYELHTTCRGCEREVHNDDTYVTDDGDGPYCDECYWDRYDRCTYCDRDVPIEDVYRTSNGDAYCERCYTRLFAVCAHCEHEVPSGDAIHHEGETYCEDCFNDLFTCCEHCGEWYPNEDVDYLQVRMGDRIREVALCPYCKDEDYRYDPEEDVWVRIE